MVFPPIKKEPGPVKLPEPPKPRPPEPWEPAQIPRDPEPPGSPKNDVRRPPHPTASPQTFLAAHGRSRRVGGCHSWRVAAGRHVGLFLVPVIHRIAHLFHFEERPR